MLTLITGVPGSGKTLYGVQELLLPVVGKSVKVHTDDGVEVEHPRTIYTNIRGLALDHELCEAGAIWERVKEGTREVWRQAADGNRLGFHNWHEWAKPGAVFLVDEFQRLWPPRPNGAPVPPDVQALDTHRHMGVDFILITQNANNVDRHVLGLIGRHLHVRRIANMPMAIVYEWDHCSRSLMYSKAITKSPWRYKRSTYKLYNSAQVHTKQPRSIPPLLFVVLAAVAAAAWFMPTAYSRIVDKASGVVPTASPARPAASVAQAVPADRASAAPHGQPAPLPPSPPLEPLAAFVARKPMGCITFKDRCDCYGEDGALMSDVDPAICRAGSQHVFGALPSAAAGRVTSGGVPDRPTPVVKESSGHLQPGASMPLPPIRGDHSPHTAKGAAS